MDIKSPARSSQIALYFREVTEKEGSTEVSEEQKAKKLSSDYGKADTEQSN